jgi:hypothetical protein
MNWLQPKWMGTSTWQNCRLQTKQPSVATYPCPFQAQLEQGLECSIAVLAMHGSSGVVSMHNDVIS